MTMLEKIRKKRNMTRQQLSDESGISLRTIEAYEQGTKDLGKAQINILNFLADALEVRVPALTGSYPTLSDRALKLYEELCLASDEELLMRDDVSGDIFKDDNYIISCITGSHWFGDHGTPINEILANSKRYVFYMISKKNSEGMPVKEELFAGTRLR